MSRKIIVGSCHSCPYVSYNHKGHDYDYCRAQGEVIQSINIDTYSFPDFCKLEEDEVNE